MAATGGEKGGGVGRRAKAGDGGERRQKQADFAADELVCGGYHLEKREKGREKGHEKAVEGGRRRSKAVEGGRTLRK